VLSEFEDEEVLSLLGSVDEHAVADPGQLSFAVVFGIQDQLVSTCAQSDLRVVQSLEFGQNDAVDQLIIHSLLAEQFFLMFLKESFYLRLNFEVKHFELPNANARARTRIILDLFNFRIFLLFSVNKFDIVVNGKDLGESVFVKHLVDAFGDHGEEFFSVGVADPEDDGVGRTEF
jgi:hypothetical protein